MLGDNHIWKRVQEGDTRAFGALYESYWEELYHIVYWRVCDADIAKDLVQELFIYLWEKKDFIDIETSMGGYLKIMARYKVLNYFKAESIRKKHTESAIYHLPATVDNTLEQLTVKEIEQKYQSAVEKLPEKMQAIYRLSREKDCSITHISEQLSLAPQTLKNQLTAAMKKVRAEMEPVLEAARPSERKMISLLLGIDIFI